MPFHVQGKMIGSGECPFAQSTLKRTIARVFAIMSRQFIRSGEFPSASLPRALVRFLARVRPQVGLQMGRFRVRLGASRVRTGVNNHTPFTPSASATGTDRSGRRCGRWS